MKEQLLGFWNASPLLRDFLEGLVSAAVGGAALGVLGLSLPDATAHTVLNAALVGAIAAVIAFARHRLEDSVTPKP